MPRALPTNDTENGLLDRPPPMRSAMRRSRAVVVFILTTANGSAPPGREAPDRLSSWITAARRRALRARFGSASATRTAAGDLRLAGAGRELEPAGSVVTRATSVLVATHRQADQRNAVSERGHHGSQAAVDDDQRYPWQHVGVGDRGGGVHVRR